MKTIVSQNDTYVSSFYIKGHFWTLIMEIPVQPRGKGLMSPDWRKLEYEHMTQEVANPCG